MDKQAFITLLPLKLCLKLCVFVWLSVGSDSGTAGSPNGKTCRAPQVKKYTTWLYRKNIGEHISVLLLVYKSNIRSSDNQMCVFDRSSSANNTNPFGSTFCFGLQRMIFEVRTLSVFVDLTDTICVKLQMKYSTLVVHNFNLDVISHSIKTTDVVWKGVLLVWNIFICDSFIVPHLIFSHFFFFFFPQVMQNNHIASVTLYGAPRTTSQVRPESSSSSNWTSNQNHIPFWSVPNLVPLLTELLTQSQILNQADLTQSNKVILAQLRCYTTDTQDHSEQPNSTLHYSTFFPGGFHELLF